MSCKEKVYGRCTPDKDRLLYKSNKKVDCKIKYMKHPLQGYSVAAPSLPGWLLWLWSLLPLTRLLTFSLVCWHSLMLLLSYKHRKYTILNTGPVKQKHLLKIAVIYLSISLNMCFRCSKEPSHQDGSFEYPQHMFWLRNKKDTFLLRSLILGPDWRSYALLSCGLVEEAGISGSTVCYVGNALIFPTQCFIIFRYYTSGFTQLVSDSPELTHR